MTCRAERRILAAACALCIALPAGIGGAARAAEAPLPVTSPLAVKLDAAVAAGTSGAAGTAPAVSVAIVEGGRIVYARAAGFEDVGAARPATIHTRFRIASITKTFTAVALMQLVERGAIGLDEPLATYLPEAPHAREVSVRQLLMHSSGIPNFGDAAFATGIVSTATTPAAIVASMADRALEFTPGSRFSYSNTGYVLLGLAIERVAKMPLAAYERDHLFIPAGMTETTSGDDPPGPGAATGYMDAAATPAPPYDASWLYAAGDIVSTPSDVARFDIALMNGTLISAQSLATMRTAPIATGEDAARYGLGISLFALGDLTFVGHHGGVPGFEGDNETLPDQRFAIVVFGNAFSFSTAQLDGPLLAALFPVTSARAVAERKAELLVTGPGEDPALTARFSSFFSALQRGRVDRTTVSAEMNEKLTAESLTELAQQLASLGALRKLVYRSKVDAGSGTVFHYTGVFANQTAPMIFSLDSAGKIAGVFFQ